MNKRREGQKLIKGGHALMDTSFRTKQVNERSVIALASIKKRITVSMKSSEKKKIFKLLEEHHNKVRIPAIVQSVKIYYALHEHLDSLPGVYICADGHNPSLLKHYLKNFLKDKYDEKKINILSSLKHLFGKKNLADRTAYGVTRGNDKPTIELEEKHFRRLSLIKRK